MHIFFPIDSLLNLSASVTSFSSYPTSKKLLAEKVMFQKTILRKIACVERVQRYIFFALLEVISRNPCHALFDHHAAIIMEISEF